MRTVSGSTFEMNGTTAVLSGQVEKKESQELAKEVALSVADVKNVDNRLTQNPAKETSASKDLELEIRDGVLETKVKNILLTKVGTNAMKIEVEADQWRREPARYGADHRYREGGGGQVEGHLRSEEGRQPSQDPRLKPLLH